MTPCGSVAERHPGVADKERLMAVMELERRVVDLTTIPSIADRGQVGRGRLRQTFATINPATGEVLAEVA